MTFKLSLRARVLAGMGVVVVALVVTAIIVTTTTHSYLVAQLDDRLAEAVDIGGGRQGEPPGPPPRDAPVDDRPSDFYLGEFGDDGELHGRYDIGLSGEEQPAPDIDLAQATEIAEDGDTVTVDAVDGDVRYRLRAGVRDRGEVAVVALPLTDVDDAVSRLVIVEALVTAIVVAILAAVAWWVVRLGIRPINQMTDVATRIAGGDRTQRVPESAPSTEAGQLGIALNHMLERLDDSFEQQAASEERLRRFVADASHELRTPVTTIRGYAELYRVGGLADRDELDEAMRRTEQEAVRMARLVDDLLNLAKLDEGRPLDQRPVDLSVLAADAARDAAAVDPGRSITTSLRPGAVVLGDEDRLRQVVANIVGNALVHTPAGTPIELRVDTSDGQACIAITDRGPGMPADVANRVTQRFYRADPARTRHRGGTGLGMSIADAAVVAHGGSIGVDSAIGVGTTVTVRLPAAGRGSVPPRR